ncbi:MAG: SCP2 sterol-binding domain-containing protein [Dehalococcoidia bacterium]
MALTIGTQEWADAAMQELNNSQTYKEVAKNWEGDMYVIIEPDASFKHRIIGYFDLWHGECRSASAIKDETEKSPQYRISGPYTVMKQLLEKKLDPVKAMMTGKLKVKGNMGQIMRMPRAALEFTNCLSTVDAVFPD